MATPSQKGLQAAVVPGSPQDPNSMDARASRALGGQAAELAYEFDGQQGRPGVADIVNPLWAPLVDALNGTGYGATPAGAMTVKVSAKRCLHWGHQKTRVRQAIPRKPIPRPFPMIHELPHSTSQDFRWRKPNP